MGIPSRPKVYRWEKLGTSWEQVGNNLGTNKRPAPYRKPQDLL